MAISPVKEGRLGKRRLARELALQMLFQRDLGDASPREIFALFRFEAYVDEAGGDDTEDASEPPNPSPAQRLTAVTETQAREAFEHAKELVQGTVAHLGEIDDLIRQQAENWRLERMPPVDRNVLRLAVFELLYAADVPKLVVVDEAVELAKRFGAEQSSRFVNGLLDGLLKSQTFPGSLT